MSDVSRLSENRQGALNARELRGVKCLTDERNNRSVHRFFVGLKARAEADSLNKVQPVIELRVALHLVIGETVIPLRAALLRDLSRFKVILVPTGVAVRNVILNGNVIEALDNLLALFR